MTTLATRFRSLGRVLRRDPGLAVLTCTAWLLLVVGRAVVGVVPLRRIVSTLGRAGRGVPADAVPHRAHRRIRRIRRAIAKAVPHTPTRVAGESRALAALLLLVAYRIPSTTYFGVIPASGDEVTTHVWVSSGPIVVTGAPMHRDFATVGSSAVVPPGSGIATVDADLSGPPSPRQSADGGETD